MFVLTNRVCRFGKGLNCLRQEREGAAVPSVPKTPGRLEINVEPIQDLSLQEE